MLQKRHQGGRLGNSRNISISPNESIIGFPEHYERYVFASMFTYQKEVIDIGCKWGLGAAYFGKYAKRILAVDIQDIFKFKSSVPFEQVDFTKPLHIGNPFDVAICLEVIEHVKHPERIIENAHKVLKPDGLLVLSTPSVDRGVAGHLKVYYTQDELNALLSPLFDIQLITEQLGCSWMVVARRANDTV